MRVKTIIVGLLACLISGCSGPTDAEQPEPEPVDTVPASQNWALGDGKVDEKEYRKALDDFMTCMKDAGYESVGPVLSPLDGLTLLFEVQPSGEPAVYNAKIEECNSRHLSWIEPGYVEAGTQVMDDKVRLATVKCLEAKGLKLTGTETNVTEFVESAGGSTTVVMPCAIDAAKKLYPELPNEVNVRW
jgi:hypothetical protein